MKTIPTINSKNQVHLQHEIEDDDCNYCNVQLTGENSVVFNMCSNEKDMTILYCKPCAASFMLYMNLKTGDANNIPVCVICGNPNPCKCKAKKINYNLRKKLK